MTRQMISSMSSDALSLTLQEAPKELSYRRESLPVEGSDRKKFENQRCDQNVLNA